MSEIDSTVEHFIDFLERNKYPSLAEALKLAHEKAKKEREETAAESMDSFFDKQPVSKPRVHRGPEESTCTSCEG